MFWTRAADNQTDNERHPTHLSIPLTRASHIHVKIKFPRMRTCTAFLGVNWICGAGRSKLSCLLLRRPACETAGYCEANAIVWCCPEATLLNNGPLLKMAAMATMSDPETWSLRRRAFNPHQATPPSL
jgi:hypothetical protein